MAVKTHFSKFNSPEHLGIIKSYIYILTSNRLCNLFSRLYVRCSGLRRLFWTILYLGQYNLGRSRTSLRTWGRMLWQSTLDLAPLSCCLHQGARVCLHAGLHAPLECSAFNCHWGTAALMGPEGTVPSSHSRCPWQCVFHRIFFFSPFPLGLFLCRAIRI